MENEDLKTDSAAITADPDSALAAKTVAKPADKPATKPASKPATKPTDKPATQPVAKPVAATVVKTGVAPVTKPTAEQVKKPDVKKTDKKQDKKTAKSVAKLLTKTPAKEKTPKVKAPEIKKPKREKFNYELRIDLLGKAIKKARKERKLTQKELGQLVGVKKAQISKLENSLTDARFETIIKVFKALNVKVNFNVELLNQTVTLK